MSFRSGNIAILGKPNVGKSTLVNSLIGQKVAAVTDKPQTTRQSIRGIRHSDTSQMVFLDTPGFHHAKKTINRWMVKQAKQALKDADISIILISAEKGWKDVDEQLFRMIKDTNRAKLIVITKIDLLSKSKLLPMIERISVASDGTCIIPVCAIHNDGIDILLEEIESRLPEGPILYPPEQPTDQSMRQLAAELIREKLFAASREEVPYSLAVQIESYKEPLTPKDPTRIDAVILVERKSQKGIVIGKGGKFLKEVGIAAREELESIIGGKVFLSLFVKVAKDWTEDPIKLRELGYV